MKMIQKSILLQKNNFTNIKFRIPRKEDISFLRLDPIDKVADIQIKNIRVVREMVNLLNQYH